MLPRNHFGHDNGVLDFAFLCLQNSTIEDPKCAQ